MADSIRKRVLGRREEPKEINHYELRVMYPGESTWQLPEFEHDLGDLSRLQEPLDEEAVSNTAETEGWPSGKYKLQGRYTDGTMAATEWMVDHEGPDEDDQEPELTEDEKLELAAQRAIQRERDAGPRISTPDEMMGAIGGKVLDGSMPEGVDMNQLAEFVDAWQGMTATAPTSPDEVAGMTWQAHMAEGNTQAATAILSDWFTASAGGGSSLIDRALEDGNANVSWETIKALGALKFLDDPRSMVREVGGGMLEAEAGGGAGRSGGNGAGSALGALFGDGADPGTDDAVVEQRDDQDADEADETEPYQPRRPSEAVAVDLDTLGTEQAEEAAQAVGNGGEPDPGGDGPVEPAAAETGATGGATDDDGEPAGAGGLDEAMGELEEEIDREAGEYPNAAEAMPALAEAAEGDAGDVDGDADEAEAAIQGADDAA